MEKELIKILKQQNKIIISKEKFIKIIKEQISNSIIRS